MKLVIVLSLFFVMIPQLFCQDNGKSESQNAEGWFFEHKRFVMYIDNLSADNIIDTARPLSIKFKAATDASFCYEDSRKKGFKDSRPKTKIVEARLVKVYPPVENAPQYKIDVLQPGMRFCDYRPESILGLTIHRMGGHYFLSRSIRINIIPDGSEVNGFSPGEAIDLYCRNHVVELDRKEFFALSGLTSTLSLLFVGISYGFSTDVATYDEANDRYLFNQADCTSATSKQQAFVTWRPYDKNTKNFASLIRIYEGIHPLFLEECLEGECEEIRKNHPRVSGSLADQF